ncbi:MAG TPA: hypothetical protein VIY48_12035 [Candidatus Paceibacterota bacterium]
MGYAVKKDGTGWRAVETSADVDQTIETYQTLQPAPIYDSSSEKLKKSAIIALDKTDMVAIRCIKAGVVFPADWQSYTQSLRAIVNGTDTTTTTIPVAPAYPAGT